MSKILTTNKLVDSTKRRAMLPLDQVTFTKQDVIDILNEEMDVGIIPKLLSTHEEYLVAYEDVISGSIVDNSVSIPYRAIGNKLRGVQVLDSSGTVYELARIQLENIRDFQDAGRNPYAFYVQNNKIILLGSINNSMDKVRLYFYLRPSTLVDDKFGAKVIHINKSNGSISIEKVPENFSPSSLYEFTGYQTPNKLHKYDVPVVSVNNTSKVLMFDPANIPQDLIVGDYVTVSGESIVPQIPVELHPVLAQRAALHCIEALGDLQGLQLAQRKLQELELSVVNLIDNRVESSNKKITNRNGFLRSNVFKNNC